MNITVQPYSLAGKTILNFQKNNTDAQNNVINKSSHMTNNINLNDSAYGSLLINRKAVSFGNDLPAVYGTDAPSIQKKINASMAILGKNDIILAGPNIDDAAKALRENIDTINNVAKRIVFVEEPKLKQSFVIGRDDFNMYEVVNISNNNFLIESMGKNYAVKPKEGAFLTPHDNLLISGLKFEPGADENAGSQTLIDLGVKMFDFGDRDLKAISNINLRHLEDLSAKDITDGNKRKITFSDVGGQDEAIDELKKSVIYPIKFPAAYRNSIVNKGIILTGGPGTGKSLMAEALANESDAHYIKLNGLEMESKFVGQSEENWRNLFEEAKANQPCIMFIDEFDAVAKNRDGSDTSRYDDKVVNQLLTLMSDLEKSKDQVYVVVATNKIDLLDSAILRSGRFGKHIAVGNPDLEGCKKIAAIHMKNKPIADNFDKDKFAQKLFGIEVSGADISHIVNEAYVNMYQRTGIFEKMASNTFKESDVENLQIEAQDFDKAIDDFEKQREFADGKKKRNPIGFAAPIR